MQKPQKKKSWPKKGAKEKGDDYVVLEE